MEQAVLTVRIHGSDGAYKASADIGGTRREGNLGALPPDFLSRVQPLEEALLLATATMPDVAAGRAQVSASAARSRCAAAVPVEPISSTALTRSCCRRSAPISSRRCFRRTSTSTSFFEGLLGTRSSARPNCRSSSAWRLRSCRNIPGRPCSIRAAASTSRAGSGRPSFEPPNWTSSTGRSSANCQSASSPSSKPKELVGTSAELNTDGEQAALDRVMKPLRDKGKVKLCPSADGTWRELTRRITKGD